MDNSEVYWGLKSMAVLEAEVFGDPTAAKTYDVAADSVRSAISQLLYNPDSSRYRTAKLNDDSFQEANLDVWYPGRTDTTGFTLHLVWPHLFGVEPDGSARTLSQMAELNASWDGSPNPDWTSAFVKPPPDEFPFHSVGHASLLAGDETRAVSHANFVKSEKFPIVGDDFAWPFTVYDAGWLLRTWSASRELSLSSNAIDFGDVEVGQSVQQTIQIKNTNFRLFTVSGVSDDSDQFSFSPTVPLDLTLYAGDSAAATVTFAPTLGGDKEGTITITHDAEGGTTQIFLFGSGIDTTPPAAPTGLTAILGNHQVDLSWAVNTELDYSYTTVYRSETESALGDSVARVEKPDSTFSDTGLVAGTYTYRLKAVDGTGNPSEASSALSVTLAQGFSQSKPSLSFGEVEVSSSATLTFSVSNTGQTDLTVTDMTGLDGTQFSVSPTSFTIPSGGDAQEVTVTFTPGTPGEVSAILSITHDAEGSPAEVSLSGTGVQAAIEVTPAPLAFGTVGIGETLELDLSISNAGNKTLLINTVAIAGTDASEFPLVTTHAIPFLAVPANSHGSITVPFEPATFGSKSAVLTLTHNDTPTGTVTDIPLTGEGATDTSVPEITFRPAVLDFEDGVAPGDTVEAPLVVSNPGDRTLVVSGVGSVFGGESVATVTPDAFELAPGDSISLLVQFSPHVPGAYADALIFETNIELEDPSVPRPTVSLSGLVNGPDIQVVPQRLTFESQGIGLPDTQQVGISNVGNDTLRIAGLTLSDSVRFRASADTLILPEGETRELNVVYTPDSTRARVETLEIESDDFTEGLLVVTLEALEVPKDIGAARLSLDRADSLGDPQPGDTISVTLVLKPNGDVLAGVDVFFGFDTARLAPASPDSPFVAAGHTEGATFLVNRVLEDTADSSRTVVFFSVFLQANITAEGALARLDLVVLDLPGGQTVLRSLNELPLRNSQYITASLGTFTLPAENHLELTGNAPPVVRPFATQTTPEDTPATVVLGGMASDRESPDTALTWTFFDPDSLIQTVPLPQDPGVIVFFPPEDGNGVYLVTAVVSDPEGASDTTVVVLEVTPANDPPDMPVYETPADGAADLTVPITFRWQLHDRDRDDTLTADLLVGIDANDFSIQRADLTANSDTVTVPAENATYFWQVVARDAAGEETKGPVWEFTTIPDLTPPEVEFVELSGEPTDLSAVIAWRASEFVTALVRYGLASGFSDSAGVETLELEGFEKEGQVVLTGLGPGTEYAYQMVFADGSGNEALSDVQLFMTVAKPVEDEGDLDGDRQVTFFDFVQFGLAFNSKRGEEGFDESADLNGDGEVGFLDFIILAARFGNDYRGT